MSEASVVLYGASGYTGKHVAWKLGEKGIPFVAAGRNKERLAKQLGEMPELAEAEYEIVAVDHDEAALTTLFEGKKVVHNLVGPFMQLGEPVVRAALNAGVHYLDATGEQDWMLHLREVYGPQFERKGLVLSPACASMWNSGMMVAELVLEREGIDSLDIVYTLHGVPSVWFQHDPRVRNCSTLVAFRNQMLMDMVIAKMTEFDESYAHLPVAEQEAVTNAWAMQIAPQGEPPREDLDVHRVLFTCHGRGTLDAHSVAVWGATGYVMAGVIGATTIEALLLGRQQVGGGLWPATAVVGARHLLDAMIAAGICGQPKELIV